MTTKIILALALIMLAAPTIFSQDKKFCELWSCPNRTHTVCKFQPNRLANNCRYAVRAELDADDIKTILHFHNFRRQPKLPEHPHYSGSQLTASSFSPFPNLLEWDDELAYIAQRWANQCENVVDECRNVERFNVTQRISMIKNLLHEPEPLLYTSIVRWYEEDSLDRLDFENLGLEEASTLHLSEHSALAWGNDNRIGCGFVRSIDYVYKKLFLVCNYGYTNDMDMY